MDAIILFAVGTGSGLVLFLVIAAGRAIVKRGVSDNQITIATLATMGAIILALVGVAFWYPRSFAPSAMARLNELKLQSPSIRTRVPCVGFSDLGFNVDYHVGHEYKVGRLCRPATGGEWAWYPNTNDLEARQVPVP